MNKYTILSADSDDTTETFRFAAIREDDESVVYSFEDCAFKEINDMTQLEANLVLLEDRDGELVHIKENDPRATVLSKNSNEILKQFIDDLYAKLNQDVEHIEAESP